MTLDTIFAAIFSLGGIVFTFWFFLMRKEDVATVAEADGIVEITVNGGYKPEVVSIPVNKTSTLSFIRSDPSSCLEEIVIPEFKIKEYLPLHEIISVDIHPKKKGTYEFACGMNMFHGKLIVEDPE